MIMYMGTLREHTHIYIYISLYNYLSIYIYIYHIICNYRYINIYISDYVYIYIQYVLIFTHTCYSRYRRSPDIRHIGISSKIFHNHNMYVSVLVGANVIDVQHEVWLGCLTGKELKPAKQQWMKFRVVQESISQFWISRS